jgi:hypothetical protein
VNYQEQELKKTVNQCQYQNDSDARIIWQMLSSTHHDSTYVNN